MFNVMPLDGRAAPTNDSYSVLNLFANSTVTFNFQTAGNWPVSFYAKAGPLDGQVALYAAYQQQGQSTQPAQCAVSGQWAQIVQSAPPSGNLQLVLSTQDLPPEVPCVEISGLQIGPYPIDLERWVDNQNNPITTWIAGTEIESYSVTLSDSAYASAPISAHAALTFEMWIQPGGPGPICALGSASTTPYYSATLLEILSGGELAFHAFNPNQPGSVVSEPTGMLDGEWHHVAAVCGPGLIGIWLDGESLGSVDFPGFRFGNVPFYLGLDSMGFGSASSNSLAGSFDEVRIWNVALTTAQINDSMHHEPDLQDPTLIAYWNFDKQDLTDSSSTGISLTASSSGSLTYSQSPIDLEPEGQPYLVTQAMLMQDYLPDTPDTDTPNSDTPNTDTPITWSEISGYRVVIGVKDGHGNPSQAAISICLSDPGDNETQLFFMDGSSAGITFDGAAVRTTDPHGEVSFVIQTNLNKNPLTCPVLKVSADFMAPLDRVIISPDRQVHATLSTLTGAQILGQQPLPTGKTATLGSIPADQQTQVANAVATAISHMMTTAVDHNLQPERPVTRTRDAPEDTPEAIPLVPRYQNLYNLTAPYDFTSNAILTHFASGDLPVARILVPEDMPDPHWSLSFDSSGATFASLSLEDRTKILQGVSLTHVGALATLFEGEQTCTTDEEALLEATQRAVGSGAVKERWSVSGFYEKLKSAAKIVVTTAEATVKETGAVVKSIVVTAIDDANEAVDAVVTTVEDAVDFVGALITKIGADVSDVVDFVKAVFNWSDIQRTAGAISSVLAQAPAVIEAFLKQIDGQIDQGLDWFQDYIDSHLDDVINQLGPTASFNSQTSSAKNSPPPGIQTKYMKSMYGANASKTSDTDGVYTTQPSSDSVTHANSAFSSDTMSDLTIAINQSSLSSYGMNGPAALLDAALGALLRGLKDIVDKGVTLMKTAVSNIFKYLTEAVNTAFELAGKHIHIPYLTYFFENVVMGGTSVKFSFLGLVSAMAAIPATVIYKLINGVDAVLFSDADITTVSASGWLTGACTPSSAAVAASAGGTAQLTAGAPGGAAQYSLWDNVCFTMSSVYMVSTEIWGITCAVEDALGIAESESLPAQVNFLYGAKMSAQAITNIAGFPSFVANPRHDLPWKIYGGLYLASMLQLYSNFLCPLSAAWSSFMDPLVTGALGVGEFVGGILYASFEGGSPVNVTLNLAGGIGCAMEWIPQLLKIIARPLDPGTAAIVRSAIPLLDIAAYTTVALTTLAVLDVKTSSS